MNTYPRITIDPIEVLREHPAGHCAVCGERRSRLLVDHDHETGLVRGLLCNGCNASEGRDYRAPWFERYRENPPAARLGLHVPYSSRLPVKRESEPLLREVAQLVSEAGWGIGALGRAVDDVAFNIIDPETENVVDCVSLWSAGPHESLFTWGDTHRRDARGMAVNTAHSLPASTALQRVAHAITWTLDIRKEVDRLEALLTRDDLFGTGLQVDEPSFSVERGVAVAEFHFTRHPAVSGRLTRVVTDDTDIYFWRAEALGLWDCDFELVQWSMPMSPGVQLEDLVARTLRTLKEIDVLVDDEFALTTAASAAGVQYRGEEGGADHD